MALLFALTVFVAAALLFLLEPMMGKMLLPEFGGAPAVWNVCMAFFQAVLLAGYAYAHWLTRLASIRLQLFIHLAVVTLPWLVLPFVPRTGEGPSAGDPTWALIALLTTTAGLPFFVLASTSPLLGQWLAACRPAHRDQPYYLYAAGNAGSLIGLLAYPCLVEPRLTLPAQGASWCTGYGAFMLLAAVCLPAVWRRHKPMVDEPATVYSAARPTIGARASWLALAFVPSSLLLGVTAYLSTDVSPVPLIWVVPLALYLFSFVLVFSRSPPWLHRLFAVALPLLVLAQIYHLFEQHAGQHYSMLRLTGIHLAAFFSAAMVCHGELARRRPAPRFLTEYAFCLSLGGVLGGMFNALVAPLVFRSLTEYPLALSAACACSPLTLWRWSRGGVAFDLPIAALVGMVCAVILFMTPWQDPEGPLLLCGLVCLFTVGRPICFGLSAAALFLVVGLFDDRHDHVIYRERDFYGVLQVNTDSDYEHYYLTHGRIVHGKQRRSEDPVERFVPLVYYHPSGPIGQVFEAPLPALNSRPPLAVVGLGIASLACYAELRQELVFYEIDPAVERIARDDRYFTYLRDAWADVRVVLGDARLRLREAPAGHYGLIVIDAFSGDAIPIHLLTHEAMRLYLDKLAPGGVLAFHISNQFLDLAPVLGNLARASELVGLDQNERTAPAKVAGQSASHWVILARSMDDFGPLARDDRWTPLADAPDLPLWTDHYTSLWGIAHWRN
ncbi:MAG TPA: fused MFS/spermidine synthase [Pirellulales bacterium]|nr:fused MFS/spermidine synthase [Pirellulales bacterium]